MTAPDRAWWPFSSRLGRDLDAGAGRWARRSGTVLKLDISGFTSLSERLASVRRTGAEELNAVLSDVFDGLLEDVAAHEGDVLQFGGDALSIWFDGERHRARGIAAAGAALDRMRRRPAETTPAGPVHLELSAGLASGDVLLGVVGEDHRDLVALGPVVTAALEAEKAAAAGNLVIGPELHGPVVAAQRPGVQSQERYDSPHRWVPTGVRDLLTQEDGSPGEVPGEHRRAAAAFVLLSGTDAAVADGDDGRAIAAVLRTVAAVEYACLTTGVTWTAADLAEDGLVLLLFAGAPLATEHDPDRMLRALHAAIGALDGLAVRAGSHTGRVFAGVLGGRRRRTWAAIGDTTNVAARLMGAAPPGRALVSADLWTAATGGAPGPDRPSRVLALRNRAEGITAVEIAAGDDLPGPASATGTGRGPLIGREAEVTAVREALLAATAGRREAVLLIGPAGIGKSHLLGEALSRTSDAGARTVVRARANPYDQANAYAPIRADLRATLGTEVDGWRALLGARDRDLAPLLGPALGVAAAATPATAALDPAFVAETRDRLLVTALLRAAGGALVVLAEDAQMLDRATLGLLDALAAAPPDAGLAVVASLRSPPGTDESPPDWPGAEDRWRTVTVAPLSAAEGRRLVLAAAGDTAIDDTTLDALVSEGAGNPLFLSELAAIAAAHSLGDELPRTTEAVIAARIDRLQASRRRLLREAAVAGSEIGLDVLAAVLDDDTLAHPAAWRPLEDFVEVDGRTLRFRQDLYRRGAYDGLAVRRRRELHAALADMLAGQGAQPAVLAVHAEAAGRHLEASDLALAAGRAAAASGAWGDALRSLERAWACGVEAGRAGAWLATTADEQAAAADLVGRYAEAEAALTRALELSGPDERSRRLVAKAAALERQGRYDAALAALDEAQAALPLGSADPGWAAVQLRRCASLYRTGRLQDSLELARTVAQRPDTDRADRARALLRMEMCASELGLAEHEQYGQQALAAFEGVTADRDLGNLLLNLGVTAREGDDWDLALRRYRDAEAAFQRAGDTVGVAIVQNNAGEVLCDQGLHEAAVEVFTDARRVFRAAGHAFGAACTASSLGRIAARTGDHDRAARLLAEAEAEFRRIDSPQLVSDTMTRRAELALLVRDPAARDLARAATRAAAECDSGPVLAAACLRFEGLAAWQAGDPDAAQDLLARSLETARSARALLEEVATLDGIVAVGGPSRDPRSGADAARRRDEILERLRIVALPRYPGPCSNS